MALFYVDTSALVKLIRDEPESASLRTFVADADLVSCEFVLAELPRAIRRAAAGDSRLGRSTRCTSPPLSTFRHSTAF